ncbi:putative phage abortive infection protein [Enterococcus faecium]|uniref:putative phage abortive infection protein n=1 Tax=Enterococcus faecium TaxID=1352 RepID=UPI000DE89813|nr:putative phage abortive infection protein [Enterococcus faecium]EGP5483126.1 hypothetical protein [Enterococcus faecium]MDW3672295.1 putative phage abortive infection protein [Enterococcus faecium]NTK72358.1 hypothetical protein [Enterococcus faecium]NTQ03485.1 hypothetical protein [Enterococcus faecium]NTQ13928.1 hypothetical protein [Enterococcus faecium]
METDKKSFYEQHKKEIWIGIFVAIGFSCIILIPLVVQVLIDWDTAHKGSDDGWLGFWGGYLGAIIGVAGALIAIQIQLSYEKKRFKDENTARDNELANEKAARKSEQVDNTFFNLLNLFISQQNHLISEVKTEHDIFHLMLEEIKSNAPLAYRQQGINFFYEHKKELLVVLEKAINDSIDYVNSKKFQFTEEEKTLLGKMNETDEGIEKPQECSHEDFHGAFAEMRRINRIREFQKNIEEKKFKEESLSDDIDYRIEGIIEHLKKVLFNNSLLDEFSKKYITSLIKKLEKYIMGKPDIDLEMARKKQIVEYSQKSYHKYVGSYYRIFHRIIKYLNENVADEEIKKNYIGFLRANMNENQMAMIFYNITFTDRGSGAIGELKGTGFFGEKNELDDIESAHFFSPETLVWGNYDLKKMQEFC